MKHSQDVFRNTYFKVPVKENGNLKVEITVSRGDVNMYTNNYDSSSDTKTIVQKLPWAGGQNIGEWTLKNITPFSDPGKNELIILESDTNSCTRCTYLFGVHTKTASSDFEIKVSYFDPAADSVQGYFIPMGKDIRAVVQPSKEVEYKFLIDELEDVTISVETLDSELIDVSLVLLDKRDEVLASCNPSSTKWTFILTQISDNFQVG